MEQIKCDFCSERPVVAAYYAHDFFASQFSTDKLIQYSEGGWAACVICEALIDANEWDMLVERAVFKFYEKYPILENQIPRERLHRDLTGMYKDLRESGFRKDKWL